MPLMRGEILRSIIDNFAKHSLEDYDALFPSYQGQSGHPVMIRSRLYEEILGLPPAEKLHTFLKTKKWLQVEFPYPEVCIDIDTMEEYARYHR
jgi:CTP:molybdopterin cytidylyltransferase MocA